MNSNTTTVGLAVVTKDRFHDTVETLNQLILPSFEEVIVVDDSESNQLKNWCRDQNWVEYISGPNINMQAARNLAIEHLTTDIITFIDDDVYCPIDLADLIREIFENDKSLVAVGGPCPPVRMSSINIDICSSSTLKISRLGTIYGDASKLIPKESIEVDTLKGANMSFRRDVIKNIGGFYTDFGGHSQREETDVFLRISDYGKIHYDPSLLCYHKEKGDEFSPDVFKWRFRNHGRFVQRNFGSVISIASFLSMFFRLCGSPESIYQLTFEKYILDRPIPIWKCLLQYLKGISDEL